MSDPEENPTTDDAVTSDDPEAGAADPNDSGEQLESPEDPAEPADDTFPRAYVDKLRGESARYRHAAKAAETRTAELSAALWQARVLATGRLADPADLDYPDGADPLDAATVTEAVDDLLTRRPHLASRRPRGTPVGQGERGDTDGPSLAGMLRHGV